MTSTTWHVAEQFNTSNLTLFAELLDAGRLAHIGYCLPNGRTGDFDTLGEALEWMASGRNVYANVRES